MYFYSDYAQVQIGRYALKAIGARTRIQMWCHIHVQGQFVYAIHTFT